jgi:hypothetical protein
MPSRNEDDIPIRKYVYVVLDRTLLKLFVKNINSFVKNINSFVKCKLIYQKHVDVQTYQVIQDNQEIRTIVKGNKLNPEEKKEKERVRKQKQRESLRARYGDEEYKRLHAIKIAEQRKKK